VTHRGVGVLERAEEAREHELVVLQHVRLQAHSELAHSHGRHHAHLVVRIRQEAHLVGKTPLNVKDPVETPIEC
jgi:hypothetical protein